MALLDQFATVFSPPMQARTPVTKVTTVTAAGGEQAITLSLAGFFAYLTSLYISCNIASTTQGILVLKNQLAGANLLSIPQNFPTAAPGSSIIQLTFDQPLKSILPGDVFTITPTIATMGNWTFVPNGFYSAT